MTNEQLAKEAVKQAGLAGATPLALATNYVNIAYDLLNETGYDPTTFAANLAQEAVVAFAVARLSNTDPNFTPYTEAKRRWARKAAVEYHRAQES